jgi:hypothetical protein
VQVIGVAGRQRKRNPPMAARRQHGDGGVHGAAEVGIDPGVIAARQAAAECDERLLALDEIVNARVHPLRIGDDQAIDQPALGQPAQRAEQVLVRAVQEDCEIQALGAQRTAQAVEHRQEHRIDQGLPAAGRHDDADEIGLAPAQAAPGLVGGVAEARGGLEHPLARARIDVRLAVERARDGADRQIEVAREIADSSHGEGLGSRGPPAREGRTTRRTLDSGKQGN